jgi:hypothetical protein
MVAEAMPRPILCEDTGQVELVHSSKVIVRRFGLRWLFRFYRFERCGQQIQPTVPIRDSLVTLLYPLRRQFDVYDVFSKGMEKLRRAIARFCALERVLGMKKKIKRIVFDGMRTVSDDVGEKVRHTRRF